MGSQLLAAKVDRLPITGLPRLIMGAGAANAGDQRGAVAERGDTPIEVERRAVANAEHLALLWQGSAIWNEWRDQNPGVVPDLEAADPNGGEISKAHTTEG